MQVEELLLAAVQHGEELQTRGPVHHGRRPGRRRLCRGFGRLRRGSGGQQNLPRGGSTAAAGARYNHPSVATVSRIKSEECGDYCKVSPGESGRCVRLCR